jgi:hypothetical protein
MKITRAQWVVGAALVTGLLAGCGSNGVEVSSSTPAPLATASAAAPVMDPGDGGNYRPQLDPHEIADVIDNPYRPLTIGSRWRYAGESDGVRQTIEVVVTSDRKMVMGISAFVVHDTVMAGDEVVEDTYDWFTQDSAGNVWYLGEDTKEFENGEVVSTAGSWEAGVNGALPGIVMPAAPVVGKVYRQELLAGEAEDMMTIAGLGGSVTVPAGTYADLVTTRDWTPLEPDVIEEKSYARGTGSIRETHVAGGNGHAELVEYTPGR